MRLLSVTNAARPGRRNSYPGRGRDGSCLCALQRLMITGVTSCSDRQTGKDSLSHFTMLMQTSKKECRTTANVLGLRELAKPCATNPYPTMSQMGNGAQS